jgi:murein DD-endopeptidase MepM/ murein hydrolase activator NlpD
MNRLFMARLGAFVLVCIAALFVLFGLGARVYAQQAIVLTNEFEYIRQGNAGVISVTGSGLAGGVASVLGRDYPFFPASSGFAAMISVPLDQPIDDYPMQITLYTSDGTAQRIDSVLRVESGEYITEDLFILPSNKNFLLDPAIQMNEDKRLLSIYGVVTPEKMWEGPFVQPAPGIPTSPFGSRRSYTDGTTRRHTGFDLRMNTGTPLLASGTGRVVFARQLDIHGNTVIIDHGWGIFTNYSHLSEIYVVPGQFVLQGDVIGLSGNTGRSTGPHLHWEIAVNGVWVNPVNFMDLKLPS